MDRLNDLKARLAEQLPQLELREQEPMSRHTTFRVGGPAALMALPASAEEAAAVLRVAAELGIEPLFVGNGSNLLVSDRGIDGFVVKTVDGLGGICREGNILYAESGALLARVAVFARDSGLTGLEFAHGIPGSVGGALTMNAGAYGGEMAQVVERVKCLTADGRLEEIPAAECGFGYRRSAFEDGRRFLLGAAFRLEEGDPAAIKARMEELSAKRREKQPLEYPSAGSTFKRPEGYFAAALIDQCGLKGLTVGGAQVSEKHAGFVINRGGATCADIEELMEQVKRRVLDAVGVTLEPEVRKIGG